MRLKRILFTLAAIIISVSAIIHSGAASLEQVLAETDTNNLAPVAISSNGKYLVDAYGEPFFWMGDTAWEMHHRLTMEEIQTYLDDRQQKGINVILFKIPFFDLEDEPQHDNRYGDIPFIDQDITQPNEAFFQLVDFSLSEMEERGMTAGFLPLWGFVVGGKFGFNVSDEDVSQYAHWVSNRYQERKNIVWIVGGDTGVDPQWAILGRELKPADPQKLVTFHPGRNGISSYHMWGDADWLDFHMTQTGHSPDLRTNYETISTVYHGSSKPILNGEPVYEEILFKRPNQAPYKIPPHQVRKAAYWSLLSGGFGHVYGHVEIFQFAAAMPEQPFTFGADSYWMEALNAPGMAQIGHLSALLRSIPWHTFTPRQELIASGNPSGAAHIRAAMSADQTRALIYFPEQQAATIQLSELAGALNARWFDPQTGQSQYAGTFEANGSMNFAAPFAEDSLLILEPAGDPTPTYTPGPPTATATPTGTATATGTEIPATVTPTASATTTAAPSCWPEAGESIINGNFEDGTANWYFSSAGSGSFSTSFPAYACESAARIDIYVYGKNTQFFQANVPLKANTRYHLSFAAYSASGKDLTAELLKHTSPYTNYGLSETVDLGSGWQLYTVDFTTDGFAGEVDDGRLRFRLNGQNNDSYWIDAVSLVEASSGPPTETATATSTLVPTLTHTPTATPDSMPTNTPTQTPTPTATETATPVSAATNTPTATSEAPTATPTQTAVTNCLPQPGEAIVNGGFEDGTSAWKFATDGSGSFTAADGAYTCDLAAKIRINVRGKVMQFYQEGVHLKANTSYRLKFAAYSATGSDLTAELLKHTAPYTNYGLTNTEDLGTGWQLYTVDFTTAGFAGEVDDGRLRFRLYGKNNDTYWIDAVSLVEAGSGSPTETATPTSSATATSTPVPALTHTPTATPDSMPTNTPTQTPTPTATETATPVSAATNTPTATSEAPTATPTQTAVPNCLPQPGEAIINGDFEDGTSAWKFATDGSGSFTAADGAYTCDLAAKIRINVRGKVMQFYQEGVQLKANTSYRLKFAAYSATGSDLAIELLKHTSPYTNYGLAQMEELGTGWQLHTVDFTTDGFTGEVDDGRLRFRLYGKNNDTYWIDAVSLMEIGAPSSTGSPNSFAPLRSFRDTFALFVAAISRQ